MGWERKGFGLVCMYVEVCDYVCFMSPSQDDAKEPVVNFRERLLVEELNNSVRIIKIVQSSKIKYKRYTSRYSSIAPPRKTAFI